MGLWGRSRPPELSVGSGAIQGLQSLLDPPELFKGSEGSQGFKSLGRKMGDRIVVGRHKYALHICQPPLTLLMRAYRARYYPDTRDAGSGDLFDVVLLDVDHPPIEPGHMRLALAESGLILLTKAVSLIAHVQAVREKLLPCHEPLSQARMR
uniref:Uncharacterized protein n=1 Tax=Oryza rufipogon TaxID=4529 RepID=A0A0E0PQR6_ORYRU